MYVFSASSRSFTNALMRGFCRLVIVVSLATHHLNDRPTERGAVVGPARADVVPIDHVIESRAQGMVLSLAPNGQGEQLLVKLHDALLPHRQGSCDVSVQYIGDTASARLTLGPEWSVRPSRELRDKLTQLLGSKNVRMLYLPRGEIR